MPRQPRLKPVHTNRQFVGTEKKQAISIQHSSTHRVGESLVHEWVVKVGVVLDGDGTDADQLQFVKKQEQQDLD